MPSHAECVVLESARLAASQCDAPLLLAVSGGLDSMTLLGAMTCAVRERIAGVATFDHGTGEASARAVAHVVSACARLGVPVVTGRLAAGGDRSNGLEAMWREARHRFLREEGARVGARVVTAHTRDDQVEAVLMRELRGSGARGLAGLAAPGATLRPFLGLRRAQLERFARARGIEWIEDPSNESRTFFRNRIRLDLLPAMRAVDPAIDEALVATGRAAARWRAELEAIVDRDIRPRRLAPDSVVVATTELADYDRDSLAVLWSAIAARAGLVLDARGTRRCAAFTMKGPHAGTIPLAGGWTLEARGRELVLGRRRATMAEEEVLPADGVLEWGRFRFSTGAAEAGDTGWAATLPEQGVARVRGWRPGDRIAVTGGTGARRVKRYLSEAGVRGSERSGWPVVVVDDEVVWIPGVRRTDAAPARSGGPARHYLCERTHG